MGSLFNIPTNLSRLERYLAERESGYHLKPGTEARIVWNGAREYRQTDFALVYLHGFKASHPEGDPTHRRIAQFLGANLYLSRLPEHGMVSDSPLEDLTEQKLLDYAEFALKIGQKIGKKVILMGTSTGGSLALYLAAQPALQDKIGALILYSPLIRFYGLNDKLLKYSFIRFLLSIVPGNSYQLRTPVVTKNENYIWNTTYALKGALALGNFVAEKMHARLFEKVTVPVFTGYYYKNKREQDKVVSVRAIKKMIGQLGTSPSVIHSANFPAAGSHVICSSVTSKSVPAVIERTKLFLKDVGVHRDNSRATL